MLACSAWLGSRVVSVLDSDCSHGHTHRASVHQAVKLVAALLRVAGVTAGLAESNGSLPPDLWLTSPAGWLPRTGISSGTRRSVIEYRLPLHLLLCVTFVPMFLRQKNVQRIRKCFSKLQKRDNKNKKSKNVFTSWCSWSNLAVMTFLLCYQRQCSVAGKVTVGNGHSTSCTPRIRVHISFSFSSVSKAGGVTIRYDTRCYFNVRSKADISRLNLPHGTDN